MIVQQFLIFNTRGNFPVNRKDLQALTLVGPTKKNPVSDPLVAQHLDNQLNFFIFQVSLVLGLEDSR